MKKVIDVSHHQKEINFEQVKQDGISGVIIRAGYSTTFDSYVERNVKQCQLLQIPFALYWYSYAVTTAECEAEVNKFLEFVDQHYLRGVPLFLDMEDADGKKAEKAKAIGTQWDSNLIYQMTDFWLDNMYQKYLPNQIGLYASQSYYQNYLDKGININTIGKEFGIIRWVARWATEPPKVLSDMWQYTNSHTVQGISGKCDMSYVTEQSFDNIFYGVSKNEDLAPNTDLSSYTVAEMIDEIMRR